jgi:serine/threonine protein kinase
LDSLISLTHPNIITVYSHFASANYYYLILDYCENGSLQDLLAKERTIPTSVIFEHFRQLISAMAYLHSKNFCHRDIKPANILIDKYDRPKLADFGFAAHFTDPDGKICGSLPYMSPELVQHRPSDPVASDIWALGITFYEMAFGQRPWIATRPNAMSAEIIGASVSFPAGAQPNLVNVIKRMLEPEPEKRCPMHKLLNLPCFSKRKLRNTMSLNSVPTLQAISGLGARSTQQKNTLGRVMRSFAVSPSPTVPKR